MKTVKIKPKIPLIQNTTVPDDDKHVIGRSGVNDPTSQDSVTLKKRARSSIESLPEILTPLEVEAFLRIDVKTIYRYAQQGYIPYLRIQSNIRFSKHQILRWLEGKNFQPRLVRRNGASRQ